jgi:hypothetical protein
MVITSKNFGVLLVRQSAPNSAQDVPPIQLQLGVQCAPY